jgi:hypothetical protein
MHPSPEEPAVAVLAPDPSRRGALRALGAAGMALAGVVGLETLATSAARNARAAD